MLSSLGPHGAHTIGLSVCMFEIQRNAGVRHQLTRSSCAEFDFDLHRVILNRVDDIFEF